MSEQHRSRGGRRPGAGRKPGHGPDGEPTVAMRIPVSQAEAQQVWLQSRTRVVDSGPVGPGSTLEWVGEADLTPPPNPRPLFLSRIPAGFPSPADDYVEARIDLNTHLVKHPAATFFLQVNLILDDRRRHLRQ